MDTNCWKISIYIFLNSLLYTTYCDQLFRIDPPIFSSILKTTTEKAAPIVNKQFFIHSAPDDEKPLNGYYKSRPTSYRIFFITLPKLLDTKTKFATQTNDGTVVYILNRKDKISDILKQSNNLLVKPIKTTKRPTTTTTVTTTKPTTTTTTTTTTPKPLRSRILISSKLQYSTTTPKTQPTPESEPEIITASDIESDYTDYANNDYENQSKDVSTNAESSDTNNGEYVEFEEDS